MVVVSQPCVPWMCVEQQVALIRLRQHQEENLSLPVRKNTHFYRRIGRLVPCRRCPQVSEGGGSKALQTNTEVFGKFER